MSTIVVAVVVAVLVMFFLLLCSAGVVGLALYARTAGIPKMKPWESRLVRDKVNAHCKAEAEKAALRKMVEAAGYEPQE